MIARRRKQPFYNLGSRELPEEVRGAVGRIEKKRFALSLVDYIYIYI